jgi:hypothetical protein
LVIHRKNTKAVPCMAVAGHALDICFALTLLYSLSIIRARRATACSLVSTLTTSVSVHHKDF